MMLFVIASTYHMWLGMQVIIEDYVHSDLRLTLVMLQHVFLFRDCDCPASMRW